ncbi:vWA domain-containing protein [Chloroflexus sp.]|uniref:vWA domain-containing protein n=1 Tax=Chloroflexus sp. TaxID=1904827 RepID=UPI002623BD90|nr:VWA domain-containing protein [uncultured Chloroflexus sp.]
MNLLAPLGLLALLTLPVIVILHMMQSRRRRTVVPSLLLWQQVPLRPATRRRRLRFTFLLLLHMLAALLLGLALAQPQIPWSWPGATRATAIIIDTSTSMALAETGGSRIERARQRAATLISQMRGADRIVLISAGPSARLIDQGSSADSARLLAALRQITIEGVGSDLFGAFTIAETFLLDQPGSRVIWLTDGALPPPDLNTLRLPLQVEVIGTRQPNRAIVTLAAYPNRIGATDVYARLVNFGDQPFRGSVRLLIDGQLDRTEQISIRPDSALELTWTLPGAAQQVRLEMNGNDGLPLDDSATVNIAGQQPIRALLVADDAPALARALQAMPEVRLQTVTPAAYAPASDVDLSIFVNTLPSRWPAGGVLVINPPTGGLLPISGTTRADSPVTLTPAGETLLRDVNFGGITWGQVAVIDPPSWLTPLLFNGDIPLIMRGRFERSEVAVWSFDLTASSLSERLAFPLLVARTARDLMPPQLPTSMTLGASLSYRADVRTTHVELTDPTGTTVRLALQPAIPTILEPTHIGIYQIREWAEDQLVREAQLPVNAGAIDESDPTPRFASATRNGTLAAVIAQPTATPQPLWSWLIIATIALLVGEWLYIQRRLQPEAR